MDILSFIVTLVVYGLIFWLIWWFVTWVGLPQPFLKVAQVIIGLFALIVLVTLLLSIGKGGSGPSFVPLIRF